MERNADESSTTGFRPPAECWAPARVRTRSRRVGQANPGHRTQLEFSNNSGDEFVTDGSNGQGRK